VYYQNYQNYQNLAPPSEHRFISQPYANPSAQQYYQQPQPQPQQNYHNGNNYYSQLAPSAMEMDTSPQPPYLSAPYSPESTEVTQLLAKVTISEKKNKWAYRNS